MRGRGQKGFSRNGRRSSSDPMIYEYALEPELVATWSYRQDYRYFIEKFGLGQPRVVSRFPKSWKGRVWEAFHSDDEIEKKRMEELLVRLSERMTQRRGYVWDPNQTWLDNAHREHERIPFHAILARVNSTGHPSILPAERLDETAPLWAVPRGVTISRSAAGTAAAIAAMLRVAQTVIFVDPYFRPGLPKHRRPLEAFLHAIMTARPIGAPLRVEVHASSNEDHTGPREFFEDQCRHRLPQCVPETICLGVLRLGERLGGQRLHNRYILTDIGGLVFGAGLDDGAEGETDDVTLMERAQYELRWAQHAGDPMAFDVPEARIEIRTRR